MTNPQVNARSMPSAPSPGPLMPHDDGPPNPMVAMGIDYLRYTIDRTDVENADITTIVRFLGQLLRSRVAAQTYMERVAIDFSGWDSTPEELFEIPEVRNFIYLVDEKFPYWLFFLDPHAGTMQVVWRSFVPPFLTPEAAQRKYPARLQHLLTNRWLPAMNEVAGWAGLDQTPANELFDRVIDPLVGRRR